ncbi:MAG: tetratricopeptide repeat protein [Caulobacteraceae bacterium]
MADVFLEVDEQLRSARLQMVFRKSWPYALGVLVAAGVVALGVWGYRQHEADTAAKSSLAYSDAAQALASGDAKLAQQRFETLAKSGTPAYRALSLMQEAGLRLKADDATGAAKLLDQAAASAPNQVLGDAARLQAAYVVMDTAPYGDVYTRLNPLTEKGRPYRALAREALAVERLAAGRTAEARGDFQVLALSSDSSDSTRARANAAMAMIEAGTTSNVAAIAKGAIGLTPVAPPPAAGPGQLMQAPAQPAPTGTAQ